MRPEPLDNAARVLNVLYSAIADLNLHLPKYQRILLSPGTALFGAHGSLDSLSLANLIVILEEKLNESFGFAIDLTQDDPFSPDAGHFESIGSLGAYICDLLLQSSRGVAGSRS